MADEPKKPLLKKDGKFVKKNGKLVRTDDPENCECCTCVECCEECFAPEVLPRIIATRLFTQGFDAVLEWDNDYPAPQVCNVKFQFIFYVKDLTGRILATIRRPSVINVTTEQFRQRLVEVCEGGDQPASIEVVLSDPNGNCGESNANPEDGPDYGKICGKPCNNDLVCESLCCGLDGRCKDMIDATKFPFEDACPDGWSYAGTVLGEPGFEWCCPPNSGARPIGRCCPFGPVANPLP